MRRRFLSLVILMFVATACEPMIASRGNVIDPDKLAEVKVGSSTRENVAAELGTPTMIGTFDDKVWYYVGRQTQQYSFFDPEVVEQNAIEVRFDDQGIVTALNKLDLSEAHDVEPAEGRTPTYGNDNTLIRQLLGNLSHPMPNMGQNRSGK